MQVDQIIKWLCHHNIKLANNSITLLPGAASSRKYFRMTTVEHDSQILMLAQPNHSFLQFIKIAKLLAQAEVTVPKILFADTQAGWLVMQDFGDQTFLSALNATEQNTSTTTSTASNLYNLATAALVKIQSQAAINLPLMDQAYIIQQLAVFKTWFLQRHLAIEINYNINNLLNNLANFFYKIFSNQSQVFVHLDYHSTNLMVLDSPTLVTPGILDFQDAMLGPITYDLVSLFQDAYITWEPELIKPWIKIYLEQSNANLANNNYIKKAGNNIDIFLSNFYLTGLQRHLKNLGVFARLYYRDQKSNFLQYIPNLLNYINQICNFYPSLETTAVQKLLNTVTAGHDLTMAVD